MAFTLSDIGYFLEVARQQHFGRASRELGISHRTVEIYRARLMRKYQASTAADLVQRLMGGV